MIYQFLDAFGQGINVSSRLVNVPKWSKRDQNGQPKCSWPFGPIWTLLDHFRQKMIFLPQMVKVGFGRCASEQKINVCLKWSKRVRMGPKGKKHLGWPFWSPWTLLGHFGTLTSLPCLAIFGPKWTIFGHPHSPVMNDGPQSKKRLITRSPMCGLFVEPQNTLFGT